MKCPNCNNENPIGSKFCIHCGNPLPQEETVETPVTEEVVTEEPVVEDQQVIEEQPVVEEPVVEEVIEPQPVMEEPQYQAPVEPQPVQEQPVQQPTQPQQPAQAQQPQQAQNYSVAPNAKSAQGAQPGQRRSLFTVLFLIGAVVVVAILGIMFLGGGSPEKLYKTSVEKGIEVLLLNEAYDSKVAKTSTRVEVSSTDREYKDINGLIADLGVQYDLTKEQVILTANVNNGKDSYLNLNAFADLENKKLYAKEENLYTKTIEYDIPAEYIKEIKDSIDLEKLKNDNKTERKEIAKTLVKAINNNISKGKFTKNNVKIKVDGKDKAVKDNVLSFSSSQFKEFLDGFAKVIAEDKNFAENVKAVLGEEVSVEDMLDEIADMSDSLKDVKDEGNAIEVHYYTSGMSDFVGLAFVFVEDGEIGQGAEIMMVSKDTYKITVNEYGSDQEVATIKVNKFKTNNVDVEIDMTSMGAPVTIRVITSTQVARAIDSFDTSNTINVEDMDEEDLEEIKENLEDSPLYSIIESIGSTFDGYDYDFDYDDDDDDTTTQRDDSYGKPYVVDYSDENRVEYKLADTFVESDYSDENYRIYNKKSSNYEYATVATSISYDSAKDHLERDLKNDYLYDDPDFYSNIKISSPKIEKINGRDYYVGTVEYNYGSSGLKSYEIYYTTQITKDYCYCVDIEDDDGILTSEEINNFLNITVK